MDDSTGGATAALDWDLLGEGFDATEPRTASPARTYVVCSTPRSGSSLLCDGLTATGRLGAPIEYFNAEHRRSLSERWGCATLAEYVDALTARRSSEEGAFGAKLHWDHLLELRSEQDGTARAVDTMSIERSVLDRLLPVGHFVIIRRRDINAQAVSMWIALQTQKWGDIPGQHLGGNGRAPVYMYEGVAACRSWIEASEAGWTRFFANSGVRPVEVLYEDLAEDYEATIERVACGIGIDAVTVAPPRMRIQRDGVSRQFREQFAADRQRLSADFQPTVVFTEES